MRLGLSIDDSTKLNRALYFAKRGPAGALPRSSTTSATCTKRAKSPRLSRRPSIVSGMMVPLILDGEILPAFSNASDC